MKCDSEIMVGYDIERNCRSEITMDIRTHVHGAIVGQSGSGKSIALLWMLYQILSLSMPVELYLCDPKNSGDFSGIVPPDHFGGDMMSSVSLIHKFYKVFQNTPENSPILRLIIIEEYAGLISALPDLIGGKDGRLEVETLKNEMAIMFMLSRSRTMGIWLIMQRPSASLFSSSSGALDNLMFSLNMGKIHTQTRISLFANEDFENKEFAQKFHPSCGSGYFLQDGKNLQAVKIPLIRDKSALLRLLQKKAAEKFIKI